LTDTKTSSTIKLSACPYGLHDTVHTVSIHQHPGGF
jgi:hypothetical protein